MSFKSLNHILVVLENQTEFQGLQEFRHLLACWSEVVQPSVISHTQPISISRGVVWVATSSSSWANTLSFQRRVILKKLNALMPNPLVDIRFSTAQWQNNSSHTGDLASEQQSVSWQEHPSRVVEVASLPPVSQMIEMKDPDAAFQHWAEVVKTRSQHLPLCPQCQCPTPSGELDRWDVCAICIAQQW